MHAIVFDLDTETLKGLYPNDSYNNAYYDIRTELTNWGFTWMQGSVYFGEDDAITPVTCVLAVQSLSKSSEAAVLYSYTAIPLPQSTEAMSQCGMNP